MTEESKITEEQVNAIADMFSAYLKAGGVITWDDYLSLIPEERGIFEVVGESFHKEKLVLQIRFLQAFRDDMQKKTDAHLNAWADFFMKTKNPEPDTSKMNDEEKLKLAQEQFLQRQKEKYENK